MNKEKWEDYPKTDKYRIVGVRGVPHPYVVGVKIISYCADNWSGMLSKECIEAYEKKTGKPSCEMRGCELSFDEHKQALAVEVDDNNHEDTVSYLLSIKDQAIADGYEAFCFFKSEAYKAVESEDQDSSSPLG